MARPVILAVALLLAAAPAVAADGIQLHGPVPSAERPQGELRLVQQGRTRIVQTLLVTKVLRRVVAGIAEKEAASWPPERSGHADSQRYVTELQGAQRRIAQAFRERTDRTDRRQLLLIEFELAPEGQRVVLSVPRIDGASEPRRIVEREPLAVLDLSRDYIRENMRIILADGLGISLEQARTTVP